MKKNPIGNVDKIATQICHRIYVNEGCPRDREMLYTALLVAYQELNRILSLERMNREKRHSPSIKRTLKMIQDILDGKIAIKYGEIHKLKNDAPPEKTKHPKTETKKSGKVK